MADPKKGETWVHSGAVYPDGAVEILECDGQAVRFAPKGGGFVYRAPIARFLEHHVYRAPDATEPPWRTDLFELDEAGPWPGYWKGYRWNGWATPQFEREVMIQILDAIEVASWREEGQAFVIEAEGTDPLRVEGVAVEVDGQTRVLYAFDGWCFSVAAQ